MNANNHQDDTLIADLVRAGLDADLVGRVSTLFAMFAVLREQSATERNRYDDRNAKALERMRKTRKTRMELGANIGAEGKNAPSSLSSSSFFPKREKEEEEKKKESKPLPPKSAPLPARWDPSAAHFEEGTALGFSRDEVLDQAQDMRIWAGANAHRAIARKSSWDMTFSGWMRRARKTFAGQTRRKAEPVKEVVKDRDVAEAYFADLERQRAEFLKKSNGHGH